MPRLNVIAMIVLCLGVFAGAATMALRTGPSRNDAPRVDRLIRQLGDTDPDLRREAERELKDLGRKAEPALKEAATGADPVVAQRARQLLGIKPGKASKVEDAAPVEGQVRLTLQIASMPRGLDEPAMYYLRLTNGTSRSVAIARRLRNGRADYRSFGVFERIDAEGRVAELVDAADAGPDDGVDVALVAPGESVDLFPAAGLLKIGARGTVRVRYVYDASEASEYREKVTAGHHAGSALPPGRLESNEVAITIP